MSIIAPGVRHSNGAWTGCGPMPRENLATNVSHSELIALSAITCPAKLCETCQKKFPPFFDVKIEEIMLWTEQLKKFPPGEKGIKNGSPLV
jgi:hypothetical protein